MSHTPSRLDIENVSAGYNGRLILQDLSFQVPHGAQMAVVGPNGAGKSTLFKVLVGLLPLRSGRIFVHGEPLGQHKDCVAYVPQRERSRLALPGFGRRRGNDGAFRPPGLVRAPGRADWKVVERCLAQMGTGQPGAALDQRAVRRAAAARLPGARPGPGAAHPADG